jgi:hypothetical protein
VSRDPLDSALEALLSTLEGDAGGSADVEQVLTAGYGRALELEAERARIAVELQTTSPARAHRLRALLSSVTERLVSLRTRLDEANRRHRASRKQHLDGRAGPGS